MTPNELRIGNLVHANNVGTHPSNSYLEPHTIADGKDIENAMWYFPIALTEEWLLKFGFVKDADGNFFVEFNYTKYKSYIIDINSGISAFGVSYQDDTFYFAWNIKYVHQLQNLYFALTGEELTIKTK